MMPARTRRLVMPSILLALVVTMLPSQAAAMPPVAPLPWEASGVRAVPGDVVVTFRPGTTRTEALTIHRQVGVSGVDRAGRSAASPYVVQVGARGVGAAIARYLAHPSVASAEPNRIATPHAIPSDARFEQQWGLHNTGQTHRITDYDLARTVKQSGANDADVDAPEAWDVTTGDAGVIIAVIDSGVDRDHNELDDNIWENDLEINGGLAGVDDDGNGYVDDRNGWDFIGDDGNPSPQKNSQAHGTHVAGIAAGEQGSSGITGICPGCTIMPLRIDLSLGQEIEAIEYAVANGADIINMSFGGQVWSLAERNAIEAAGDAGVLSVISAGNSSLDNDLAVYPADSNAASPSFPASYNLSSILTVAASDDRDRYGAISQCRFARIPRWVCAFTSWGHDSVDVAAPGVDILSTVPDPTFPFQELDTWDGTSMSAPLVAGIAGLVKSANPGYDALELKNAVMNSVDTPGSLDLMTSWAPVLGVRKGSLEGAFTRTQGRVNAFAALTAPTTDATPLTDGNIDGALPMTGPASGAVNWPQDTNDVWAVELTGGQRYTVVLDGPATRDLDLWVWSPTAIEIHQLTSGCFRRRGSCPALRALSASPDGDERVEFNVGSTGTYYIQVNAWYDKGAYDLRVRS